MRMHSELRNYCLTLSKLSGLNRGRRGISEIVGALLLIVTTVAIAAIVLVFTTNSLGIQSSNFTNVLSNSGQALSDNMVVEQVQFTSNVANLYLRNDGSTQILVATVYLLYANNNSEITFVTFSPPRSLSQGSFIVISVSYQYSSLIPYTFVIVAQDGSKVSINAIA